MEFCKDCSNLVPTEYEQDNISSFNRTRHWCRKFKKHVQHGGFHPELPILIECRQCKMGTK